MECANGASAAASVASSSADKNSKEGNDTSKNAAVRTSVKSSSEDESEPASKKAKPAKPTFASKEEFYEALKTFVVYNKANPSGLYKPAAGFLLDHIRDDVVTSPLWDAHLKNRRAALQTHGRPLSRPETANGVLSCGGRRILEIVTGAPVLLPRG